MVINAQVQKNYSNIILPDKFEIYNLFNDTLLRNEIQFLSAERMGTFEKIQTLISIFIYFLGGNLSN
jgi:hypothetical protein